MTRSETDQSASSLIEAAWDCMQRRHWLLDLDDTLYQSHHGLFQAIRQRITEFVATTFSLDHENAEKLQTQYYEDYGTTLCGLVRHHNIDPRVFLDYVHDVDYTALHPDSVLRSALQRLDRPLHIYTNADARHARTVMTQLGVSDLFPEHRVFDIFAAEFYPKPTVESLSGLCAHQKIVPTECLFADDLAHNLVQPSKAGMRVVHVDITAKNFDGVQTPNVTTLINTVLDRFDPVAIPPSSSPT